MRMVSGAAEHSVGWLDSLVRKAGRRLQEPSLWSRSFARRDSLGKGSIKMTLEVHILNATATTHLGSPWWVIYLNIRCLASMSRFLRLRTKLDYILRAPKPTPSRTTSMQQTRNETHAHYKYEQNQYLGIILLHWSFRHLDSISILKVLF